MKTSRRIFSVLMAICMVVLLLAPLGLGSVSVHSADYNAYVIHNGEAASEVTLPQDGKLRFQSVINSDDNVGCVWQINDPAQNDCWVNIDGAYSRTLWVTYALVGSMLQKDGSALVRCKFTVGENTVFTAPVKVTVAFAPHENTAIGMNYEDIEANDEQPRLFSMRSTPSEDDFKTHSIIINYLFDNNALAFEPYGATVAHGSDFKDTIKSPEVAGYEPYRRVGEDYISAAEVVLDYTNIQQDIIINIVYEPALVNFSVHHHLQNLLDDDYSIHYDYVTTSQAITGTVVGDGLALTEEQLPGFRALAYEKLTVAADGSTVIEIRYDRNYYLVDFDMNGGYGTEPVYTRYGATVGANDPIRHGYVFGGWELISYDGRTPTNAEKSRYAISADTTILVPDANLRYRARWVTQETTYTVVFWKENADNNDYSYWGYLDGLTAMSGSVVSGTDIVSRVSSITDEQYFTFNSERTDKNVIIEGDGSTVINVYYTRNYYTLDFKAPATCGLPVGHWHTDACYDEICGLGHKHSSECESILICPEHEHTAHTEDCIICGKTEHVHGGVGCNCKYIEHTHANVCWGSSVGDAASVYGAPSKPVDGQVYRNWSRNYYIYIKGSWYSYKSSGASSGDIIDPVCGNIEHKHGQDCSCDAEEHAHTGSCYADSLHTHVDACYKYSCNQQGHDHNDNCYRLNCGIPENHSHNNDCKKSSSNKPNVVKRVYRKYEQSLADIWPVVDEHGKIYDDGQRWSPGSSSYYSQVLVYIAKMTPESFTLTLNEANNDTFVMNYYLQVLPGRKYDYEKDDKHYELNHTISANYNYLTYDEDFFEISGYTRYDSDPNFSGSQLDINGGGTVNFFYDRTVNNPLIFNNNGIILDDKTVEKVMYQAPLKEYYFEPSYPSNLEPGAYSFGGWYTTPNCFDGTEVNWDTIIMEDGGLQLYAKWQPITHTVRVFKDATLTEQIGSDQIVAHKAFAYSPNGTVENGNYVFQGWFYIDSSSGKQVEKAFVFNGIPITRDLDIYAKWSSHVSVDYRINYVLKKTGEPIADPTIGSAIAGHNKTFEAKAGNDLYEGFRSGYYPLVNSHTITMSVDGTREFTFEYVYVESVPYTVQYIDAATGNPLFDKKTVDDNNLSVVTEVFKRIDGKMPDAYQKRLVLVAGGTDEDGDNVLDENNITFYYNSDEQHAYYHVVHYIQNISGDDYREYRSEETVGNIGETYTVDALKMTGFNYNPALTKVNGEVISASGTSVSQELPAEGMLIELYYERVTVPYTVRYLNSTTREEIYPSKTGSGVFGLQVAEYAPDLTSLGYDRVGEEIRLLTLSANPEHNVLEFTYQEKVVSIKYQIVGPDDCGTLSFSSENVLAISGEPNGSTPTVKAGFVFMGWFTDEDCTVPADESIVDPATNTILPKKVGDIWQSVTYYAKIIAPETDLTIYNNSVSSSDAPQAFLFRIKGKADTETAEIDLTVTIVGNGHVTVTGLPVGDYTVTRLDGWSWRYANHESYELTLQYDENGTEISYNSNRIRKKWLDGNAVSTGIFKIF